MMTPRVLQNRLRIQTSNGWLSCISSVASKSVHHSGSSISHQSSFIGLNSGSNRSTARFFSSTPFPLIHPSSLQQPKQLLLPHLSPRTYQTPSRFVAPSVISALCSFRSLRQNFCSNSSASVDTIEGDSSDPENILRVLHRVQEILGHTFKFSRIVMIGDQSTGKTSVVEAIIGEEVSHKDSTMATRRPTLITLIRTPTGPAYARFRDGEKLFDFKEVKNRVTAENAVTDGDVSTEPVEFTVYSPDVFDTILIDLPGYIMIPEAHQDDDLPDQIQRLNASYMGDPLNIMAVVSSATQDPATSMALREAQRADKDRDRCLGVVTKIDLVGKDKQALHRLLSNRTLPLAMGRIGIRCRTQQEQLDGISFQEVANKEKEWIEAEGSSLTSECRLGVPLLKKELSRIMIDKVCGQLPMIIDQLDQRIAAATHNQGFLQRLANEPDMRSVTSQLEMLVNQLHSASDSRRDLEESMRNSIYETCCEVVFKATRDGEAFSNATDLCRATVGVDFSENGKSLRKNAQNVLNALDYKPDKRPRADQVEFRHNISRYRELLVYGGEGHMDDIDSNSICNLRDRAVEIGTLASYFNHTMPANPRRARSAWTESLGEVVDDIVEEHKIVEKIFEQFTGRLQEFASKAKVGKKNEQAELARMYFAYLLERIATRIHEESLKIELEGMIERERRPIADFLEHQNELAKSMAQVAGFPEPYVWLMGVPDRSMDVCMFNEEWTDAYLRVMTKRISDDFFRILTVRLLEPLVFECIQFTLKLFSNNNVIAREAELQSKQVEELKGLKEILSQTYLKSQENRN